MAKTDKLTMKVAKARQAAFAALQSGLYAQAAKACLKAEQYQRRLYRLHKKISRQ